MLMQQFTTFPSLEENEGTGIVQVAMQIILDEAGIALGGRNQCAHRCFHVLFLSRLGGIDRYDGDVWHAFPFCGECQTVQQDKVVRTNDSKLPVKRKLEMNDTINPASHEDMLPIGMLGNGRGTAKAMETVAIRKNNVEGWQPFHYEKISATEFEVSGGIPALIGGAKRWPEPHTTVIVSEVELAQELEMASEASAAGNGDSIAATASPVLALSAAPSAPVLADAKQTKLASQTQKYMTVILRMPDDVAGHQRIADMLALENNFFGAVVMATAFQEDIQVSQLLQKS